MGMAGADSSLGQDCLRQGECRRQSEGVSSAVRCSAVSCFVETNAYRPYEYLNLHLMVGHTNTHHSTFWYTLVFAKLAAADTP